MRETLAVLAILLQGCSLAGSASLASGRSAYNAVINTTEDEQILSMIVRRRYDETFGMLAVASVTASLRVGASAGAQAGVGPSSGYAGNLVPFSAGATYEENPTISYVPMRGEQFVARMLAPLSAGQVLLLSRMSTPEVEVLRLLVRRANGLINPLYGRQTTASEGFDRFVDLYVGLRERGRLDVVGSVDERDAGFELLLHDYAEDASREVGELLRTLGIHGVDARGDPIALPLRFGVGARRPDALDLETPSALEVVQALAAGVRVPDTHLSKGLARRVEATRRYEPLRVESARVCPRRASVVVRRDGWCFYVDGRDARSKQTFMILRTLIGMRLDEAPSAYGVPLLTVPVAR